MINVACKWPTRPANNAVGSITAATVAASRTWTAQNMIELKIVALSKLTANWHSVVEDAPLSTGEKEAKKMGQKQLI
jgi:hypothetical protein